MLVLYRMYFASSVHTLFWALAILFAFLLYMDQPHLPTLLFSHSLHSQMFPLFGTIFNFVKQTSAFSFQNKFDRKRVKCKSSKVLQFVFRLSFDFCVLLLVFVFSRVFSSLPLSL